MNDPVAEDKLWESLSQKIFTEAEMQAMLEYIGWSNSKFTNIQAEKLLGGILIFNQYTSANIEQGFLLVKKAADQDDLPAMNIMGILYAKGLGVEKNSACALQYYVQAAEKDLSPASNQILTILF